MTAESKTGTDGNGMWKSLYQIENRSNLKSCGAAPQEAGGIGTGISNSSPSEQVAPRELWSVYFIEAQGG